MKHFSIIILIALFSLPLMAQMRITALTDQPSYLVGECLNLSVKIDGQQADAPNRVAYVELSDTRHLCAQSMISLSDEGFGWASVNLPSTMHSGYYLLTVYTRSMLGQSEVKPYTQLVPVINMLQLSRQDNIRFLSTDSLSTPSIVQSAETSLHWSVGEEITLSLPSEFQSATHASVSLIGQMIQPEALDSQPTEFLSSAASSLLNSETEGHQVLARVVGQHRVNQCMLSTVGKAVNLYSGQPLPDSTWVFYTDASLHGTLPVALTATDFDGNTIPMDFVSPFARLLPASLPQLTVRCQPSQLRQRSIAAQQLHALTLPVADSLSASELFMGVEPSYRYDMSEWAKFSTIREIITEFVHGAHRGTDAGIRRLFIADPATGTISDCPALLLLDGVPVYDTDKLLEYDARLLEFVRIYQGRFLFGSQIFCGVISFTTQRGRLSNYRLDAGTRLVTYTFPKFQSDFVTYEGQTAGVLRWLPFASSQGSADSPTALPASVTLTAPSLSGTYNLLFQWVNLDGTVARRYSTVDVR